MSKMLSACTKEKAPSAETEPKKDGGYASISSAKRSSIDAPPQPAGMGSNANQIK